MENDIFILSVAALLHDIGKFAQRAQKQEYRSGNDEALILPLMEGGKYSHQHALYTLGFLEKHLKELIRWIDIDTNKIAFAAGRHHKPENPIEYCIALGDQASSGIDRKKLEQDRIKKQEKSKFTDIPIVSVLSLVHTENSQNPVLQKYLPLSPLDKADWTKASETLSISSKDYETLWEGFSEDWNNLAFSNKEQFLYDIDSLLERWLSFIPSATYKTEPDVSLYDHSRVTAALSVCAYLYQEWKNDFNESSIFNDQEPKWLFVMGDVQGIQKYIFNIENTKYSSKLLRARSFQIEALCRSAATTIINECGVIPQCAIMNGGGNFILVLPNTEKTKKVLIKYEKDINSYLLREYLGAISLAISWKIEISWADLKLDESDNYNFPKNKTKLLMEQIQNANFEAKKRRFHSAIESQGSNLIDFYYNKTAGGEACGFCGYRPAEKDLDLNEQNEPICKHCNELIGKATALVSPKNLLMMLKPFHPDRETESRPDFNFYPSKGDESATAIRFMINSYRNASNFAAFCPEPYSVPRNEDGSPRSFEGIASKAEGTKKIAMFKADVDNLGSIFKDGLGERISLSKLASLSRQLHHFFSVGLNNFIQNNEKYCDTIYTVFSGGDDICVIGPWNVIFNFAQDMHDEFEKFTHKNPAVTISAGIVLADHTTPVPYIAEEAELQLEKSKANPEKNAITVFNTTVSWEEYRELLDMGYELGEKIKGEEIPTSIVRKILQLAERAEAFKKGNLSNNNALWLSHLKYSLARAKERSKKNISPEFWDELLKKLTANEYSMMWKSRISACYALYKNRNDKQRRDL